MLKIISKRIQEINYRLYDKDTNNPVVVFHSDDWGAIRTPDQSTLSILEKKGYALKERPMDRYDSLETREDIEALANVLSAFKGDDGKPPIFTFNYIMANPDFAKIKDSKFNEYYWESSLTTSINYGREYSSSLNQGINENLFMPQLHGREHLNVPGWCKALKTDKETKEVFHYGLMGIPSKSKLDLGNVFQIAFDHDENENWFINLLTDAQSLFIKRFGFVSKSFIAPVYTWDDRILKGLKRNNIEVLQSARFQLLPQNGGKIPHYTGQLKNGFNYHVRNAYFEPSNYFNETKRRNTLERLKWITRINFMFKKPMIISTHRFNYIGVLDERNRAFNLTLLRNYLHWLAKRYPNVIFRNTLDLQHHL